MRHRLVIWRHGQTDWNTANRLQGHSDIPLNDVGQYQAERAARLLAGMKPTAIMSSDLMRAQATANTLADISKLPVHVTAQLRETNGGEWEGRTGEENRASDFQNFVRWIDGEDNRAGTTGERRSEVADRAVTAIENFLRETSEVQTLVIATHGGTARCVMGKLLNLPMTNWGVIGGLSNACWSVLQLSPKGWHLVEHNSGSLPEPVYDEESGREQ